MEARGGRVDQTSQAVWCCSCAKGRSSSGGSRGWRACWTGLMFDTHTYGYVRQVALNLGQLGTSVQAFFGQIALSM